MAKFKKGEHNSPHEFKKGHIPWNEGTKEIREEEAICSYCCQPFTFLWDIRGEHRITCSRFCQNQLRALNAAMKNKGRKQSVQTKKKKGNSIRAFYENNPDAVQRSRERFIRNVIDSGKRHSTGFTGKHTITTIKKIRQSVLGHYSKHPETIERIRLKRKEQKFPFIDSKPERRIKEILRSKKILFSEQYYVSGASLIDIAFPERKVAVYIDGCYWHGCPLHCKKMTSEMMNKKLNDIKANKTLKEKGWKVLRIWEHEIKRDADACLNLIKQNIDLEVMCTI